MKDKRLLDIAPRFCEEVREGLRAESEDDLAAQIDDLLMNSWRYDKVDDVLMVHVRGGRQLNVVENRVIGEKYGGTISLDSLKGIVSVDIDNFSRIRSLEAIGRPDLALEFEAHCL